jgi:hypothetical protein
MRFSVAVVTVDKADLGAAFGDVVVQVFLDKL